MYSSSVKPVMLQAVAGVPEISDDQYTCSARTQHSGMQRKSMQLQRPGCRIGAPWLEQCIGIPGQADASHLDAARLRLPGCLVVATQLH